MDTIKQLNEIYLKLQEEKNIITDYLDSENYEYFVGYFPYHSFKENDEFYLEYYPIPVITLSERVDIGVDVNQIYFEFKLSREEAVMFDFNELSMYHFEVYGIEDYYNDFYVEDNVDTVVQNIENSDEQEVGVSILIVKENITNTIKEILEYLRMKDLV